VRRGRTAGVIGALALVLAGAGHAGNGPLAATVNGVGISRDRLEAKVNAHLNGRGSGFQFMTHPAQYEEVRRQVLEALIGEELLWQEARAKRLVVPAEEVERALTGIRARFPSEEGFRSELTNRGFVEATFAEDVKRELSVARLIREEIAGGVIVSDEEVDAFIRARPDKKGRPEEARAYLHAEKVRLAVEKRVERLRTAGEIEIMELR